MRLWTLHPRHLDPAGLVACWRETLLAQAVLAGRTKGYTHHPQLERFRDHPQPLSAVGFYLDGLWQEASDRGYRFNRELILDATQVEGIEATTGQVDLEWTHLGHKLAQRNEEYHRRWQASSPTLHPLFNLVEGPVANWEKASL